MARCGSSGLTDITDAMDRDTIHGMNTSISVPDQVWARIPKDTIASRWITEAINHYADWVLLKNCIQSVNILASENPDLMTAWKKEDEELRR